ncbi:MAG TPA: hypothetical protein VKV39_09590 [Candidatus Sulfotelmatobacter sp.]|nr:hypothetical protein [Candidatus Sulfotelmatobacter sp.]
MRRESQYLACLMLSAALAAPLGAFARTAPQDDHERHEQEEREHRVYDPDHKEYHNWDRREDEAYRRWLDTKHEAYVAYEKLDHKKQREYWKWRHEHEDHQ